MEKNKKTELKKIIGKINTKEGWFGISLIHTQGYCEYQLKLIMKGQVALKDKKTEEGILKHDKIDKSYKEFAEKVPLETIKEEIKDTKKQTIIPNLRVISFKHKIIGRVDLVENLKHRVNIIDYKPVPQNGTAYPNQIDQVRAYALAFKETFPTGKTIFIEIRNRDNLDETVYCKEFNRKDKENIINTINRIHQILDGTRNPIPTRNPKKCICCKNNYYPNCDRSVV